MNWEIAIIMILIVGGIIDLFLWSKMDLEEMEEARNWIGSAIFYHLKKWVGR